MRPPLHTSTSTGSSRDLPAEPSDTSDPLEDLDWMIGTWHAEYLGVEMEIKCRWLADKSFKDPPPCYLGRIEWKLFLLMKSGGEKTSVSRIRRILAARSTS